MILEPFRRIHAGRGGASGPWPTFLALLLCLVSHLPAGEGQCAAIRIGEINPLTGKLARHGIEIHEGILFAVEEMNAKGGILGRRIELISRDDQSLPEVAINQAEDLLYRSRVSGLVGGYVDSLVGPVSELAARYRVPYVASASLQRSLTLGRDNPFFFRVAHLDGIVEPLCGFIQQVVRPASVAILYTATPGSTEFGQEVEARLTQAGIHVKIFEKFRPGQPDFSAFLLKVRAARVEALVCGGFFPDHLILARQIREQNIALKAYVGPWGVAYPSFIQEMGAAAELLFGMCAWHNGITLPGTEEASRYFAQGFQRRFGKPANTTTMHGYTSARALLAAVEQDLTAGGNLKGEDVSRRLRELDLPTPMERLVFDEKGDPRHYRQVVVQVQGGRLVAVYPGDRAVGSVQWPGP
jgi:branched-chain amino acid transport system substrate-binding protein